MTPLASDRDSTSSKSRIWPLSGRRPARVRAARQQHAAAVDLELATRPGLQLAHRRLDVAIEARGCFVANSFMLRLSLAHARASTKIGVAPRGSLTEPSLTSSFCSTPSASIDAAARAGHGHGTVSGASAASAMKPADPDDSDREDDSKKQQGHADFGEFGRAKKLHPAS
jgi:hypothetical protein